MSPHANESWQAFLTYADIYWPRIFASLIAGGIVGAENQVFDKPAGLRTCILVTLACTVITIASLEVSLTYHAEGDRIASQILPGIGFIGAGVILVRRGIVKGITTAATIFINAALGILIGLGFTYSGVALALISILILLLLRPVDYFIEHYPPFVKLRDRDRQRRRARRIKRPIESR